MIEKVLIALCIIISYGIPYVLSWKADSGKYDKLKYLLPIGFVITVVLSLFAFFGQQSEAEIAKAQNVKLQESVDYLRGQQNDLVDGNKSLLSRLDYIAGSYDTMLTLLRSIDDLRPISVPSTPITPRLVEAESMHSVDSGLNVAMYVFRSSTTVPIRDVRIQLTFEEPVISCTASLSGAFVVEQGTRQNLKDSIEFNYSTDYLSQSNKIIVLVKSRSQIKLIKSVLEP